MNLAKSFTPAPWLNSRPVLVFVFLVSCLVPAGPRNPLATTPLDPILATPAQDEALYAHGILLMAAGESWLTPRFLGRPLLVKPPLLQWLSAASVKTFGAHSLALRLPSILAAAAILTLVYHATGPIGWLILVANPLWRSRAGLLLMDDLLTVFCLVAIFLVQRDPRWERSSTAPLFGALVGLAIMTKWFAGLLPLTILLWARPSFSAWLRIAASLLAITLPWHCYQFIVNHDWFLAEYLGVELFGYAVAAPVQASSDTHFSYYGPRLLWLIPCAVPLAFRRWHTPWLLWLATLLAAICLYNYRNTAYLAPLAPALLLAYRGWLPLWLAPLSASVFLPWPPPQPQLPLSDAFRGRELLHLDPDDQLRTSLQPGATVRYLFLIAHFPPNGPLDFEKLGIARNSFDFLVHHGPEVDAVLVPDLPALRQLIEASPQRDFLLPEKVWAALAWNPPHHDVLHQQKIRLRSRQPSPGPRPTPIPLVTEF